jgi:hypothetical protein
MFESFTKKMSSLEIAALVIFIVYIVFPFRTPQFLAGIVNTPVGLITILVVTLYLFFYTNPTLGVAYIFVAYELLRRSSLAKTGNDNANSYMVQYGPHEDKRASDMAQMNPVASKTLEEEIISTMAPSQQFNHDVNAPTGFFPVADRVTGASMYK